MARPRRSHDTRRKLLDQGVTVLIEHGYHGAGLKAILDAVGVPKGSFYNYFDSKEAFGAEVIGHYAEAMGNDLESALKGEETDALAALHRHFRDLTRCFRGKGFREGCLVGNLGAELEDSDLCRNALVEAMSGWRDRLMTTIGLAQTQGTIRDDVPARELADVLVNAWEGAVLRMKIERSDRPLKQCLKHVLEGYMCT